MAKFRRFDCRPYTTPFGGRVKKRDRLTGTVEHLTYEEVEELYNDFWSCLQELERRNDKVAHA